MQLSVVTLVLGQVAPLGPVRIGPRGFMSTFAPVLLWVAGRHQPVRRSLCGCYLVCRSKVRGALAARDVARSSSTALGELRPTDCFSLPRNTRNV